jgi:hypothetical protein
LKGSVSRLACIRSNLLVEELGISERLMAAFGEHCHSRRIASLQPPQTRISRLDSHQRSSYSALTWNNSNSLSSVPDLQCLSALLLSKRAVAFGRAIPASTLPIVADELLPIAVRAACEEFVKFAPQVSFGASASNAQFKQGYKQPVRAFVLHCPSRLAWSPRHAHATFLFCDSIFSRAPCRGRTSTVQQLSRFAPRLAAATTLPCRPLKC